jgi:chromosome partitioning protein
VYTIVTASQKGGSGKTTLSGHLAVEADHAGAGPVALIDTDPQGSLALWWNSRAQATPHFVKVGLLDLGDALNQLKTAGFRLAVIDTPPAITSSISHVVAYADLVVIPTRPSPHDLRAVGATVDIAERHQKPVIFVLNGATPRARITGESAVALSQHGTVAPVTIHHRVDFAASMIDGRTVGEVVENSASAREITELWVYIQHKLSRLMRDPTLIPDIQPQNFSVGPLLNGTEESDVREADSFPDGSEEVSSADLPPLISTPTYTGPDRRVNPPGTRFNGVERRVVTFGRRHYPQFVDDAGGRK